MLVVLLSGAGLLAFAIVNLWETVRDADERERAAAERQASDTAKDLRELLQQPWILEVVASPRHFQVQDGKVLVPAGLEPAALASSWSEADLPLPALTLLQAARQKEFKNHDKQAAGKLLARALSYESLGDHERSYLASIAAWQAYRAGDRERARGLIQNLGQSNDVLPAAAASTLLLWVELDEDPTMLATLAASCVGLGEAEVHALEQRLRQRRLGELARSLQEGMQARRTLMLATTLLSRLLDGETLFAVDADLCVFRPDQTGTGGVGVILPGQQLRSELTRRSVEHMAWGQHPPGEAAVVIPGLLAIQPHVAERSFWTQPVTLIALLIIISLCFGLGLFLSFRAMLRESAAMKARADFLTSVTHELKTPLASIRLLAEMLDEGRVKGEEKRDEYYRLLAGESARLTVLIENVLDLGRMERGERAYDLRRSHIDSIVKEAIGVFDPLARRDHMELDVELGADEAEVRIDCGAFVQALLNVMENARKYAKSGERLEVRSMASNGQYQLSVRDFGPGIPVTEHEMIFQRFQRGQAQLHGNVAGVGLGLYLARTILRAHGGDLDCEGADGGGTRFRFTLPIAQAPSKKEEDA